MTDFHALVAADKNQRATTIELVDEAGFTGWLAGRPVEERVIVRAQGFAGKADSFVFLPSGDGFAVAAGIGDAAEPDSWALAKLADALPEGDFRLADGAVGRALLGWLLAQHRFEKYRELPDKTGPSRLLVDRDLVKVDAVIAEAEATALVRDLVDTPPADMGPNRLEERCERLAKKHDAALTVTRGDALKTTHPMIHAVGKAAMREHAPRLIELEWGDPAHPRVAIVGKGVCFDSGGLSIKSNSGMMLMKKDMGGAAHAIALAGLVMQAGLPVRLHLLVPAVENAVAENALRPGDIIQSRKGLAVEITNTDAEGRLVLGDALARAGEEKPELIVDYATLTGAARVALGPDLPAMFTDDDALATDIADAGTACDDPVWRMPLWRGYDSRLSSNIADCVNSAPGPFGGCITAALFLAKFVESDGDDAPAWVHFDTYAWRASARPGRGVGGDALGLRSVWRMLQRRYGPASGGT